jgi:hypothetical protein
MSVTTMQNSNIGDGLAQPVVTYSGTLSGSSTAGGPTAQFAQGHSQFTLAFQLTAPAVLSHTFPTGSTAGICTLALPGGTNVNLLDAGENNLSLAAGTYTLSITMQAIETNGAPSFNQTLTGNVSFVPSPGVANGLLLVAAWCGGQRRQRRTA